MKKRVLIGLVVVVALAATASLVWANGGLVSYWPFEGTANDVVNGNHAAIYGGPGFVEGKFGQALDFDGVDDYVDCGNDASLKPSDAFTVSAWVKYATFFPDNAGHAIVSHGYYYADNGFMLYQACVHPYNRVWYFVVTETGRHGGASPTLLQTNTWYHLALVYDGSNLTLYINGAYDSSVPATGPISWIATTPNFYIGTTYWATGAKFKGVTDEVGFWSRALSADEVAALASVDIDIKPGSYPNSINLGSKGVIPVAIFSTLGFDATQVNPDTVSLAGAGVTVRGKSNKSLAHHEFVNGDGLLDLVVQVETENLDPTAFQDGVVILEGRTFDGLPFRGQDEIVIVPPE